MIKKSSLFGAPAPKALTRPALRVIPLTGFLSAKVSAYADDITVFVSRRLDLKAVKKAVVRFEQIVGAKINFDKSEGLRLGASGWSSSARTFSLE